MTISSWPIVILCGLRVLGYDIYTRHMPCRPFLADRRHFPIGPKSRLGSHFSEPGFQTEQSLISQPNQIRSRRTSFDTPHPFLRPTTLNRPFIFALFHRLSSFCPILSVASWIYTENYFCLGLDLRMSWISEVPWEEPDRKSVV